MKRELVEELKTQLEDHDELVITDMEGNILDVVNIQWDSRNGRVEIVVQVESYS